MRISLLIVFLLCSSSFAEDRLTMVGPSAENEAVKELLDKLSKSCSEKDFRGFMDCFTPKKASDIKKDAEHAFICGGVTMDVLDFFIISADEESISFGLRYYWSEGGSDKVICCSKVVTKKIEDSWRIDSEQVKSRSSNSSSSSTVNQPAPQIILRHAGAQQQASGWRRPNPANGGEEAWLPADIMYKPGPSCANGNCRIR